MPTRPAQHKPERYEGRRHQREGSKQARKDKGYNPNALYGRQWREAAKRWLDRHPMCVHCEAEGRLTAATEVDHITPHKGSLLLFWDRNNWQPLCKSCHSRKTAKEDGGFGNPRGESKV